MKPGKEARRLLKEASNFSALSTELLGAPVARRKAARQAYEALRDEIIKRQLETIPTSRLKETTGGRVRLGPIEAAGFRTVAAVSSAGSSRLQQIPGVGPHTASQVIAAVNQLRATLAQNVRVRFDPDGRPPAHAELLRTLHSYEAAYQEASALRNELEEVTPHIQQLADNAARARGRVRMLFSKRSNREGALQALGELHALVKDGATATLEGKVAGALSRLKSSAPDAPKLWEDYGQRAVAYNGLLIETAELSPDLEAVHGFLPTEIAKRVQDQPLETAELEVSLRGYQAFGARFLLAQNVAILGDEMGLGKTIEALAVMCHLWTGGETHFLVVCPASVIVNWTHEIQRHSNLSGYRLHGSDRGWNVATWARRGGVGVTTFDSLRTLQIPPEIQISLLVVDEAHYIKNPQALRTKAVRTWIPLSTRTLFLTGTPMENRVDEFRILVGHLRPDIAGAIRAVDGLAGADAFRKAVASVYLRRNQTDVLEELPPRIEMEEWVQFSDQDLVAYRSAVASGNFMAMRRAAYSHDNDGSAKLGRLVEIVEESASNDHKIVIFSYFRDVLDRVVTSLGAMAMGPLTGSVAPAARQALVDDFSARNEPAVLVSQIEAGGVGLNMQAASVCVLAEPQWKRTTEDQAVARLHRMGQIRPVTVHRLLAEDSVDQRMLEVLASKKLLFDEYVRRSDLKEVSPDAVDVSDLKRTKEVVTQAEAERWIVEAERKRLGVDDSEEQPQP